MDRRIPTCSKILRKREKERADELLVKKLMNIKNRNNKYHRRKKRGRPKSLAKNQYYKKQREKEILLENRMLAQKMISIENSSIIRQR